MPTEWRRRHGADLEEFSVELRLLRRFQGQVRDQCRFLLMSAEAVNDALIQQAQDAVWYSLQNLLTAAANISKALWGPGGKLHEQRRPVRESLEVSDDSPLQNTDLRNHFEHFDERLERWWRESTDHNFIDRNIGPPGAVRRMVRGDIHELDWFRHFDPQTASATFWGDSYDLQALAQAANDLLPIAEREANKPHSDDPNAPGGGQ